MKDDLRSKLLNLEGIKSEIDRLAQRLGASGEVVPALGCSEQSGSPTSRVPSATSTMSSQNAAKNPSI
jgi:hypothetical protein